MYLLDTNIISDALRFPNGKVAERLQKLDKGAYFTSVVVSSELRFWYKKRNSTRLKTLVESFLDEIKVEDWCAPADEIYATIRAETERVGITIGQVDLMIAAQALLSGAIVVTANEREFSRVPGLKMENWLKMPDV
ncbi:MAG: tRNA(fMet)-specific endonuclease VapC [Pseudomonadota bacterium]